MQAIGLFFAIFFSLLGLTVLLLLLSGRLFESRHPAKVKIMILPGQQEKLEYTMRALRYLQGRGYLDICSIQHKAE